MSEHRNAKNVRIRIPIRRFSGETLQVKTKRLVLRSIEKRDASFLAELVNDPDVRHELSPNTLIFPVSLEMEERWISDASAKENEAHMIIELKRGSRSIGILSVKDIDKRNTSASLNIILNKDVWGKGYGTEAINGILDFLFERLNMHRVWLRVDERNSRAIRCYEKCGFSMEGVLRDDHFFEGCWRNSLIMSILSGEFRGNGK